MMGKSRSTRRRPATRATRRLFAFLLTPILVVTGLFLAETAMAPAAQAAGNAQLDVTVRAIDPVTQQPITSLTRGERIAFQVFFTCLAADCTNATVRIDPSQLDPNYNFYRLLTRSGFSAPATGTASISGSDAAGWTVSLGDRPAGQTGSFTVEYTYQNTSSDTVAWRDGELNSRSTSHFPDGFGIVAAVTGNADTASGPRTASSEAVAWHNNIPDPAIRINSLPSVVETDRDYTYLLSMTSGCSRNVWNAAWGEVTRHDPTICASDYLVTHQLPPGVELVDAGVIRGTLRDNPVVTGDVATGLILTWDARPWATPTGGSTVNPDGGWLGTGTITAGSRVRHITVRFPRENFVPAGHPDDCQFESRTDRWSADVDVTYISLPGVDGQHRLATASQAPLTVRCVDPFGAAVADRKTSTNDGPDGDGTADTNGVTVPAPGAAPNLKEWRVTVANQANVPGVAVVTDNTLDLDGMPVYQIEATPAGATIAWTATNGVDTISGTGTTRVDAPAGYRFATAVVTSPRLAGPNQFEDRLNSRTNFTVSYRYSVSSDAPTGVSRTNRATAVMTYPDHPQLASTVINPLPHTVRLNAPFGRSTASKSHTGGTTLGFPATGSTSTHWVISAYNYSNVSAVPIIEETFDDPRVRVTSITARHNQGGGWSAIEGAWLSGRTVQFTLDNGTTGTANLPYTAPAGRYIVHAVVTGVELNAANATSSVQQGWTGYQVRFGYAQPWNGEAGTYSNNATVTMDYPGTMASDVIEVEETVQWVRNGLFQASITRQPLPGGATSAGPTTDVEFRVGGGAWRIEQGRSITPQYVFVAPEGWAIEQGSASFPNGGVPAGGRFEYRTVTIDGVERQAVVASWPAGTSWGANQTLPQMSVIARPTSVVPAGTVSVPSAYIGNTGDRLASDTFERSFTDAPDFDGDGDTAERFATADSANAGTTVAATPAMQVRKEICLPDAAAADGCEWIADPSNAVGIPPNSTTIRYRIGVQNTGNTDLRDVVGYDVLPYIGDTGTSDALGSTPRNSEFREALTAVSNVTNGAIATFSDSTQPCRPEVDPTLPGCVDDWDLSSSGAQAIRVSRAGVLAPGDSFSLEYTATVLDAPGNSATACNSFAVRATGIAIVAEPSPVCATVQETDLEVIAGTPQLQVGRSGVLPYTVINHGGAQSTTGRVEVAIPEGLSATNFIFDGWRCTAVDSDGEPVFGTAVGPATLTCRPDSPLLIDAPRALNVPVVPTVTEFTSEARVTGRVFDGNLDNNEDEMRVIALAAPGDIGVTKDDGVTTARPGDQLTYTIEVTNPLAFETISGAVLTDTLPAGVEFVSASHGGTVDLGVVTWNLADLAGGATTAVTLTVRVLSTIATAELENTARVTAPDPAGTGQTLTGEAADVDAVVTDPSLTLEKGSVSTTFAALGDVITYTFAVENTGDVTLRDVVVSDPKPGLSAVAYTWPGVAGVLAPGESVTATATYTVTQDDLDAGEVTNTATATGVAPDDGEMRDDDEHVVTSTATPSILFDKSSAGTISSVGDEVTYTFVVTNDGPLTLTEVAIDDPLPGLTAIAYAWPGAAGVLAPGESVTATATYAARQADVDAGELVNTATATGVTRTGVGVSDDDTETITIARNPALSFDKDAHYATGQRGEAGDTIEYEFTVTNTGNVTLTDVVIDDPLPGLTAIAYTWPGPAGVLRPGQSATATATYVVTQRDVDSGDGVSNTATATASAPDGSTPTGEDSVTMPTPADSGIQLVKSARVTTSVPRAGDIVEYTFAATNLGTLTLSEVVLDDPMPGLFGWHFAWPGDVGVLAPNETVTATARYRLTQSDVDAGQVVNTATVAGRTPAGDEVADEDTETTVIVSDASVAFEKNGSIDIGFWQAGDLVSYTFSVTNDGNVTLRDVAIDDPMPGLSAIEYSWPGEPGVLEPGATATAAASYQLTSADAERRTLTNRATVSSDRAPDVTDEVVLEGLPAPLAPVEELIQRLAQTGGVVGPLPFVAGAILLGGLLLLMVGRRRRTSARPVE